MVKERVCVFIYIQARTKIYVRPRMQNGFIQWYAKTVKKKISFLLLDKKIYTRPTLNKESNSVDEEHEGEWQLQQTNEHVWR